MIITIDGPSGTGKSTVSNLLAQNLNFQHLDTGAFYRAFALHVKNNNVEKLNESTLSNYLASFHIEIDDETKPVRYLLDGVDVTCDIRLPEISQLASKVSVFPKIRKAVVSLLREYTSQKKIVAEGRDLGSIVFPNAEVKFFLTAEKEVRAKRRFLEIQSKNSFKDESITLEATLKEMLERDKRDSERSVSPLICPDGAIIIDTSDLNIEQVVDTLAKIVRQRLHQKKPIRRMMKKFFNRIVIFSFKMLFSIFYSMKVYGQNNLGFSGGIIASNHVSFFDPPILAATAGVPVHFLARESLFRFPVFKNLIRLLNAHPLRGGVGDLGVIKIVQHLIQIQEKVIMFPEGTRSEDGQIKPLKKGVANIILRTGSTVFPAYIDGAYKIWDRKSKIPKIFGKINVVYGRPIHASRYALLDRKEAQEKLTHDLSKELNELKKWIENGAKGPIP